MERTVVITGVSRGLGAQLFDQLHARGDRLVGIGRRFSQRQRERAATPQRVVLRQADLADPATLPGRDEMRDWLADADEVALLHNAGMVEPIGAIGELPADQLAQAVAVNLAAPMLLTNTFLAAAPATGRVTVLFISSGAAHRLVEGWAAYSATKRGGETFFDALAAQAADDPRVRVASANPGVMDTEMQASIRDAASGPGWFPDRDRFVSLHRDGQLPDPAEVAQAILAEHLPARA